MEKLTKAQLKNQRSIRVSSRSRISFVSIRMARITIFSWLMLFIVALASLSTRFGIGASPIIQTEVSSKPQEFNGKVANGSQSGAAAGTQEVASAPLAASQAATKPTNLKQVRALTADKLKRGLTNFMNHLNPAPYFVPTQLSAAGSSKLAVGSQAEPSTIINDGPSADALIKGPNRLVQARPLGGPLRWGRR